MREKSCGLVDIYCGAAKLFTEPEVAALRAIKWWAVKAAKQAQRYKYKCLKGGGGSKAALIY